MTKKTPPPRAASSSPLDSQLSAKRVELSHFDENHNPRMVDISHKQTTDRQAVARAVLRPSSVFFQQLGEQFFAKGDPFQVARIAGIQAAKQTYSLIPLCHLIALNQVELTIDCQPKKERILVECRVKTCAKTGAEMEALVGASIASLTFYDMVKALDPLLIVEKIGLYQKTGGKSGAKVNDALRWEKDEA